MTTEIGLLRPKFLTAAPMVALTMACFAMMTCSPQQSSDEKKVDPVSQTRPKLKPIIKVPPVVARPRVASEGDCAPVYASGLKGTCINGQPCRGFGVRGDDGGALCTCFGRDGGCQEGQRCDAQKLACVPEKEPPFERGMAR
jgi:hypothetical protein